MTKKVMLGRDERLYHPGDLVRAKHGSGREEIGFVIAVTATGSLGVAPTYLILWDWRGLVRHDDGYLAAFGSSRV